MKPFDNIKYWIRNIEEVFNGFSIKNFKTQRVSIFYFLMYRSMKNRKYIHHWKDYKTGC